MRGRATPGSSLAERETCASRNGVWMREAAAWSIGDRKSCAGRNSLLATSVWSHQLDAGLDDQDRAAIQAEFTACFAAGGGDVPAAHLLTWPEAQEILAHGDEEQAVPLGNCVMSIKEKYGAGF